jgi:hypothetical protein
MTVIRVRRHIDSDTLHLPELRELIGRDVEITVTSATDSADTVRYPLRGSVLVFDDPDEPEDDWDEDEE